MLSVLFLIFPGLMIAAAVCDIRSFQIPNRLTLALAAAWPLAALMAGLSLPEMGVAFCFAAVVLLAGFLLFAAGMLGGGDAKLISVAMLWVAPGQAATFIMVTVMAGAALALGLIMFRKMPLPVMAGGTNWIVELHTRSRDMPYGVAIAAGALVAWPQTPFFMF